MAQKAAVRNNYEAEVSEEIRVPTGVADDDIVCVIDENPYWIVEEIRDVQVDIKGKLVYLVKWLGYPEEENSWEPEENCNLARRLVTEFHQKMSEKKRNQLAQQMIAFSRTSSASPPKQAKKKTVARKPADGFPVKRPRKVIIKKDSDGKLKTKEINTGSSDSSDENRQ